MADQPGKNDRDPEGVALLSLLTELALMISKQTESYGKCQHCGSKLDLEGYCINVNCVGYRVRQA